MCRRGLQIDDSPRKLRTHGHTAIYKNLAAPEPVVAAGLRALDRGRPVVVPGWRNWLMANGGRITPGPMVALRGVRMLRPAQVAVR